MFAKFLENLGQSIIKAHAITLLYSMNVRPPISHDNVACSPIYSVVFFYLLCGICRQEGEEMSSQHKDLPWSLHGEC